MSDYKLLAIFLSILFYSCEKNEQVEKFEKPSEKLFKSLPPNLTGVDFVNEVENKKGFNIFKYRNFYNGGGVAIGDINNDGLSDIYLTGNMVKNRLYLNKGDFKFEDITETAGVGGVKPWATGVNMVDINNDGLLDIYVCNAGIPESNNHDNDLYINNGDLTFTEKAEEYNLANTGFTIHASFFDYDKDGDLDAYILNNSNIPVSTLGYADKREVRAEDWEGVPEIFKGIGDMLLRNDNGVYTDVSNEAGIYGSLIGFGLGVMISDINKDLYPDIYITNDFYEKDYLYINNQDGTFSEKINDYVSHLSLSAMGVDIADINNDAENEIFITEMLPEAEERVKSVMEFEGYNLFKLKQGKNFYQQYIQNTLQLNNGNESFSEIAYFSGVNATDWSWSSLLFDMDNNGLRDIFITNGINHDLTDLDFVDFFANDIIQEMALTGRKESIDSIIDKMPIRPQHNYAYKNNGDLTFSDASIDWGFEELTMSNGAAYGDLDNDGDLDMVVNNVNMPTFVYKNQSDTLNENNYLTLQIEGVDKNTFAIGTAVYLYKGDDIILQELMPFRGFQSSMDYKMTIGLGDVQLVDSIRVIYTDDRTQILRNVAVNQTLKLRQSDANEKYKPISTPASDVLIKSIENTEFLSHLENKYSDFDQEGLVYQELSQEGPALAIGDVDGDGNEDVFIGGARGTGSNLYLHKGEGKLIKSEQEALENDKIYEDITAAFIDADGDSDLDLIVGSGGNQPTDKARYGSRLYLNDGKGNFSISNSKIPSTQHNISIIEPADFDGDGDTDLFVGSRSVVATYGVNPNHLLLINDGSGNFSDVTERLAYDLKDAGMITDAIWEDLDSDGILDLITVSDWGTPKIFYNNGRRLTKSKSSLDNLNGWWLTITANDLDKDGDKDLILGNHGKNIHYSPEPNNPMKIWVNDFDNNGTIEQIVTLNKNGKDYPIHQKRELTMQLVSLKKQNLKASDYAKRSIDQLFSAEVIKNSIVKEVSISESVVAINEGNNNFKIKVLPNRVQLSCVCSILCSDINNDGNLDLIMGGNNFEFKPQFSRLDGSYGHVLLGDGDLNFEWINYDDSGFFVREEIKHIGQFRDAEGNIYMITALNNERPKVYKLNSNDEELAK